MRFFIFIFLLFFSFEGLLAQIIKSKGIPYFINYYSPSDYNAARQNWDAVQDSHNIMYFANTDGSILEFDGVNWNKILVSETAIFSLDIDKNDVIYVGTKNDFGYLKVGYNIEPVFVSLKNKLSSKYSDIGIVRNVNVVNDSIVLFRSNFYLFFFNTIDSSLKVLFIDSLFPDKRKVFFKTFNIDGKIYLFIKNKGIYKVIGDSLIFLKNSDIFSKGDVISSMFKLNGKLYVINLQKGFFIYQNGVFNHITAPIEPLILKNVSTALKINENYVAIALYPTGGLLILDKNLNIIQFLNFQTKLKDDKIYNLYLDRDNNLWLCLDNGIANVFLFSPLSYFDKTYGFPSYSKVYDFLLLDTNLYVATFNGILHRFWTNVEPKLNIQNFVPQQYLKHPEKFTNLKSFSFVQDPIGFLKTYNLDTFNHKIWFASKGGIGYIENNFDNYVIPRRDFKTFVFPRKDVLIASSDAIFIIKKINGKWQKFKIFEKIQNPSQPNDFFFFSDIRTMAYDKKDSTLWISSDIYGIYKLKFNQNFDSITYIRLYNEKNGLKGLPSEVHNKVFKYGDELFFTTVDGVYKYQKDSDIFVPIEFINNLIGKNKLTNLFFKDTYGNYWVKFNDRKNKIDNWILAEIFKTDTGWTINKKIFIPLKNKIYSFLQLSDTEFVVGTDEGFVHYLASQKYIKPYFNVLIRNVKVINFDTIIAYNPDSIKILNLPYKFRNLRFVFGATYYRYKGTKFSYILEGYDQDWHSWTNENVKEYSNLPPGKYVFKVKAITPFGEISNVAKFKFVIFPPWYRTTFAYFIYVLLAGLLVWLIVYLYTLRLKKQKEHLEFLVKERTKEIEKQKDILAKQNEEIQRKNRDITASIEYAKRIQTAILPLHSHIEQYLKDFFIFFKPRDIVSGDFYWFAHKNNRSIIAAVDCTGHGVPGAFMSILGIETLNTIVLGRGITDPAEILNLQHKYIKKALKQQETFTKDGMDMALCSIDHENNIVEYAGAKNPLVYIIDNQLFEIKPDRQGIGDETDVPYKKHIIEIQKDTYFYIFSDGFKDQFGYDEKGKRRKFLKKYFYDLLLNIHKKPFDEQQKILDITITNWMKDFKQTDDILVIGFKISPKK